MSATLRTQALLLSAILCLLAPLRAVHPGMGNGRGLDHDRRSADVQPAAQDSARLLYRKAREALDRNDVATALPAFDAIITRFRNAPEAPRAFYWKAFALYQRDQGDDLATADRLLYLLGVWYPSAHKQGDGAALLTRVRGRLAQRTLAGSDCDAEAQAAQIEALNARIDELLARAERLQVVTVLDRALANPKSCDAPLRAQAVARLGRLGGPAAQRLLVRTAEREQATEVHYAALDWLSRGLAAGVPTAEARRLFEHLARTSKDLRALETAIGALGQLPDARARAAVRSVAERQDAPATARDYARHVLATSLNQRSHERR